MLRQEVRGLKEKAWRKERKGRKGIGGVGLLCDFGHFGAATTGDDRVSKSVPRRMWLRMSSSDGAEA